MKFTRFQLYSFVALVFTAFLLYSCSSPGPTPQITDEADITICSQPPDDGLFDLQAASVMQILLGDAGLEDLGLDGARDLAGDMYSPESTFCGLTASEDLLAVLDEIQALYDSGQGTAADEMLEDLLQQIDEGQFAWAWMLKLSAPSLQAGEARTRRIVRNYLDVAGRASYWGNDDKADAALQSAVDTYQNWAADTVDSASIKEALRIAAEAQLLGLDGLSDQALERARDLAELDLMGEIERFEPCTSTKEDAGRLLDTAAVAQLLGVDTDPYDFMGEAYEWLDIQQRRNKGEEIPACDLWQVNLELDEVWDAGYHHMIWEGEFMVMEDGALKGEGEGSLVTHVEVPCVNVLSGETTNSTTDVEGSFIFQVQGNYEQEGDDGVFKFLFPAELSFSGVDTCNDFDESTYLPAYVIEEIHVYGGVENYDIETDTIFMVLPAEDGANQVYETLIGPVRIEIRYQGSVSEGAD